MENKIKCPNCEWEYLLGEIFIPEHFVGQPKEIERTVEGKIDVYSGKKQDTTETFYCEHCGKPFKVEATIEVKVQPAVELDFDSDYTAPLFENRIKLSEE